MQFTQILVEGRLGREQVKARYIHRGVRPTEDQTKYIRRQWLKYLDTCSASGSNWTVRPYSGKLFRLLGFRRTHHILRMTLGEVSFDQYLVSRTNEFIEKFGDIRATPVAVTAIVTTSDAYVVLGQGKFGTEKIGTIAGCMEREDPETNEKLSPHPFDQIERELTEEAGAKINDVKTAKLLGILGRREPFLVFDIRLNIPFETLVRDRTPRDLEFSRLFSIRSDGNLIRDFMLKNESVFTSDCFWSLLLWGKYTFKRDWFEAIVGRSEPLNEPTPSHRLPPALFSGSSSGRLTRGL